MWRQEAAGPCSPSRKARKTPLDGGPLLSDNSVMTEISDITKPLSSAAERFILHWGDMGNQWGVNRSVSQIQAVLYLSDRALTAEEIAERLGMARSNVSNSIRELLTWNLIRRVPIKGDRRDHYEAETDIWEIFLRIAAGRKEREIDPAISVLKSCMSDVENDPTVSRVAAARLKEMYAFVQMLDSWYGQMLSIPKSKLAAVVRLGTKIFRFLPSGKKK